MKEIIVCFLFSFLIGIGCYAQDKYLFRSQNFAGLLEGQKGSAFQLQTINGVQKKGWFTGIGAGLDYYRFRSVPLFLSVSKFLFSRQQFFVSANGGINFPWIKKEPFGWNIISTDYPAKFFFEPGIGYKINVNKAGDGVLLNVGYSYKHIREKQQITNLCNNSPCPDLYDIYDYRLKRILFKIGYLF